MKPTTITRNATQMTTTEAAHENRWKLQQGEVGKISERIGANMTTINNAIRIVVRGAPLRSPHFPRSTSFNSSNQRTILQLILSLSLALLSVVCLSNCFQNKAVVAAEEQLMANQPNHLMVPGARLISHQTTTTAAQRRIDEHNQAANETRDKPNGGLNHHLSLFSCTGKRQQGHSTISDHLKYVNCTREQISGSGSTNNNKPVAVETASNNLEEQHPSQASGEEVTRRPKRASKRSLAQQQQQQQFSANNMVSPPKLVQWSKEAVQYYEGSTLVLSCSLSYSGGELGQLKFSWFKQGKLLTTSSSSSASNRLEQPARLSIETLADYSFLRLADLRPADSGAYTCVVSNSLNQEDRTTTQVIVNVKLKWLMPISSEMADDNRTTIIGSGHQFVRVRAGQQASFECNAAGGGHSKALRVRWYRLVASTGSGQPIVQSTGGHNKEHYYKQSQASAHRSQRTMDETQIKTSLHQMDSIQAMSESFTRIELINSNPNRDNEFQKSDPQQVVVGSMHNDTVSGNQLRWRIETNSGSSSGVPSQQHEIYSRLVLDRLEPSASGLYECLVISSSSHDSLLDSASSLSGGGLINQRTSSTTGPDDRLKRFFGLFVNGYSSVKFGHRVGQ